MIVGFSNWTRISIPELTSAEQLPTRSSKAILTYQTTDNSLMWCRKTPADSQVPLLPIEEKPASSSSREIQPESVMSPLPKDVCPSISGYVAKASSTPFDIPLPRIIPRRYWINTNAGLDYALYSLIEFGREEMSELLQAIRCNAEFDNLACTHRIVRSPHDRFDSNGKTLRDVYNNVSRSVCC